MGDGEDGVRWGILLVQGIYFAVTGGVGEVGHEIKAHRLYLIVFTLIWSLRLNSSCCASRKRAFHEHSKIKRV